jgi:hypothetical protein
MEIIDTELTTGKIADRLRARQETAWTYTSTHGETCAECAKAVKTARTYAAVTGSVASTYTLSYPEGDHAGTATRSQ